MSLDALIRDGGGSKVRAKVDPSKALCTIENPFPPLDIEGGMRVFRQHLTTDGLITDGSNQDMTVDGSSTNVDFYVQADPDADRYICVVSFVIVQASQTLNEFANTNSPLTNGCRFFYEDQKGEVDIHEALKTNFDFIRLCLGQPAFGDAAGAFRAGNVVSTAEGYLPTLDLRQAFGFRWGVKLARGSSQKIVLRIRDDCTAPDQFDVICYGFERG